MGRLFYFGNVRGVVHGGDHLPPHFHVVGPDFQGVIEIETLALLAGHVPKAVLREVLDWARDNRPVIVAEWNRCNRRFTI